MSDPKIGLIQLVVAITLLILLLAGFIVSALYLYQKKQFSFQKNLERITLDHEKDILQTQLEIQEQTLQDVSRDIHDNIALGLTLSKLHLNTLEYPGPVPAQDKIKLSINLIGEAIQNLSNISKSLNADIIKREGLLKAIENEIGQLQKTGQFEVDYEIIGTPEYLEARIELVVFRIMQESFNNIIKHSRATCLSVVLEYDPVHLSMTITDNGKGFSFGQIERTSAGSGLNNIKQRVRTVSGEYKIVSKVNTGTMVRVTIPILHHSENNHDG